MAYNADTVRAALTKRKAGEKLNREEQRALAAFEKERLEKDRQAILTTLPKGVYCELARRQPKVVNEQADRYRLPLRGKTIDLTELIPALHDFLAANKHKLAGSDLDDPLLAGANSPALEMYRMEQYKKARLDRMAKESELLWKSDVVDLLNSVAGIIRQASEQIEKEYGHEAAAVLDAALEDFSSKLDGLPESKAIYDEPGDTRPEAQPAEGPGDRVSSQRAKAAA